ncbi:MAG TPA: hypothetical protein VHZ95_10460 [Polyangiales bacterium]|nr:hypothetical protein [Polyangiales bacterium]
MTKRLFVCHAKSAIESTSEAVDGLENTLNFPEGSLFTSSLPGYSSGTRSEEELHNMLAGTSVVLALVTESSVEDPEFTFELGAAWALGIDLVPLLYGDTDASQMPWPLRDYPVVRPEKPGAWDKLVADLALRLDVPARPAPSHLPPPLANHLPPPSAALADDSLVSDSEITADVVIGSSVSVAPVIDVATSVIATSTSSSFAEQAIDELMGDRTVATSDVFARLPTCEMSLEAGRAVSDVAFNRAEITDFEGELSKPLGKFVDAIGGSWSELRALRDLDTWQAATENLLDNLPSDLQRVAEWYQLGFELSTLHNLAGQLKLDGADRDAEQTWRTALDRFLTRAENARIGYEKLGTVLSLLENLAGPSSERDLSNIGRSLEEVRRYAAGADAIHTAA